MLSSTWNQNTEILSKRAPGIAMVTQAAGGGGGGGGGKGKDCSGDSVQTSAKF